VEPDLADAAPPQADRHAQGVAPGDARDSASATRAPVASKAPPQVEANPLVNIAASAPWWRRPEVLLAAMLLALHAAITVDLASAASRAFLLAHFGLFLLWQPLWQGERRLVPAQMAAVIGAAALLVWWNTWALLAPWLALLFSLIGGNVPGGGWRARASALGAAAYLLSMLLLWVVPKLFGADLPGPVELTVRLLVPGAIAIVLVGAPRPARLRHAVDLVYSLLLFLLVVVVVLGAFFVQQVSRGSYAAALAQTVLGLGALLSLLSWLWDPRGGFAGIGQLVSRYFLSLGMPFERWMLSLAEVAQAESDPARFVALVAERMRELPWVAGVEWETASGERGFVGEHTAHASRFDEGGLAMTLHTRFAPSPALTVHMRLLCRLAADYRDAKVREQSQRRSAYLEAIHETGSRLTHDVKNLLQSLRSLVAVAAPEAAADPAAVQRLMQRQLPQIAQRLQVTLDKLDARGAPRIEQVPAALWWRGLVQRWTHEAVDFTADPAAARVVIPGDVFDSVVDNLVANATEKRRRGDATRIAVDVRAHDGAVRLTVSDDGRALPDALARQLFTAPIASETGLGVGLYQAARLAVAAGWSLTLAGNRDGDVRFVLAAAVPPPTVPASGSVVRSVA
jgi:signal transduction histidine kinase